MTYQDFFAALWQKYTQVTPQAQSIQTLFKGYGEQVINDHVAFRTFNNSPISLEKLEPQLIALGYQAYGAFRFENKHLKARCYRHTDDSQAPKIFLSELLIDELPQECQDILSRYVAQIPSDAVQDPSIFYAGLLWSTPTQADYLTLAKHSEYAAWLTTMGLQANHFTVSINHLSKFDKITTVNQTLIDQGYVLNDVGGLIKGSPESYLEQSSTMADKVDYLFADGQSSLIPSCFYEFAERHEMPDGNLFDSFIEGNADKIFDSTSAK
ncbi:DUF1338 domain-containing protein [Marinomonas sp. TW1]|uniref:DUF1338 domain-containing protein n=1 Tax=Marinomonas sp. TW1 TaxID=1561203 RepID=UPI0007AF4230|nr:DUF1338 domain-containing protein [Marinomonas sp. TW1]KZN14175.1 succinyldiaminopimelate aminotransferase [Marinomonas sp. TW1]